MKTEEKVSESTVLQEQLVGIINNILQEQDNFRARQVSVIIKIIKTARKFLVSKSLLSLLSVNENLKLRAGAYFSLNICFMTYCANS